MAGLIKVRDAVTLLTHHAPPPYSNIRVRLSKCMDEYTYGECVVDTAKETLRIKINKTAPHIAQLDSLIHEWAHALLATIPDEFEKHSALWGICYARCYSVVFES